MMYDDEDDMPLPDQFLSQLDLIESQAMANMEVPCTEKEKNENNDAPVLAEVANLKNTIEDYKRQIERLQDHEMSLQGEATMLRQRLDSKQKEADSARMEMHKSVDQLNQNYKRKIDDFEQQIRSLRSQLQFADHELNQTRRISLDNSTISSQRPSAPKQTDIAQCFAAAAEKNPPKQRTSSRSSPIPDEIAKPEPQPQQVAPKVDRKWFLPTNRLSKTSCNRPHSFGICCCDNKTVSISCPITKRPLICDLLLPSSSKSLIRLLEHVKVMKSSDVASKEVVESVSSLLDFVAKFLSLNQISNDKKEDLVSITVLLEQLCSLLEDGDFLKYLLSSSNLHCAGLRLVASMFSAMSLNKTCFTAIESGNDLENRIQGILRRTFEHVLPSLLTNSALDQNLAVLKPAPPSDLTQLGPIFEAALFSLSAASCHFSVIDLRNFLADCPLLTVSSIFQLWFSGFRFPLNVTISSHRSNCLNFIQLITRSVTLSSSSIERFFNHPCQCQPIVIGVLAQIGLASIPTDQPQVVNEPIIGNMLNTPVLDAVLNILLFIESQQALKSANHQPVFHLLIVKLAEFLCRNVDNKLRDSTVTTIRQLLRLHDVLSA